MEQARQLILIGASVRAAAFSALRAGLRPWCADLFGDLDLRQRCPSVVVPAERYPARDFEAMQQLVIRCAEMHLEHIRTNGDPFEYGRARPLDFGHWSAHKLELISGFRISHGEAVAAGVLLDSIYAQRKGWITAGELAQIRSGLQRSGFHLWFPEFDLRTPEGERAIFGGLRDFQEHLGGELCVTYPRGIGARFEVHEIDLALMESALQELSLVAASHRA